MGTVPEPAGFADYLVANRGAEGDWVAYRDAQCRLEASSYDHETDRDAERDSCLARVTEARIVFLADPSYPQGGATINLNCSDGSTVGIGVCLSRMNDALDHETAGLTTWLADSHDGIALVASNQHWATYVEKACQLSAASWWGGTGMSGAVGTCRAELALAHVSELRAIAGILGR